MNSKGNSTSLRVPLSDSQERKRLPRTRNNKRDRRQKVNETYLLSKGMRNPDTFIF